MTGCVHCVSLVSWLKYPQFFPRKFIYGVTMKKYFVFSALVVGAMLNSALAENVSYLEQIKPILKQHCYKCHGEDEDKGDLRLHTAEQIQSSGMVIANDLENSELIRRITLSSDDDDFMPKKAEKLPDDQIALIRQWIEQGADFGNAKEVEATQAKEVSWMDTLAEANAESVAKLKEMGALVLRLANNTQALNVDFRFRDGETTDEMLPALSEVSEQLVWLNLANSKVTDGGLAAIAPLTNLTRLHLENTDLTDAGIAHLKGLDRLDYLNLYGTKVTDATLEHVKNNIKSLKKLYLWQAPVSYEAAMALQEAMPGLAVHLGEDHPGVVRARLTKELERAAEDKEEAVKREEEARKDKEYAVKRAEEAQKKLDELDGKPAIEENAEEGNAEEENAEEETAEEETTEEENAEEETAEEETTEEETTEEETAEESEEPDEDKPDEE